MKSFTVIGLAFLATMASAHPGEPHVHISRAELTRRQAAAASRHLAARGCASSVNAFHAKRRNMRRQHLSKDHGNHNGSKGHTAIAASNTSSSVIASTTSSAAAPHYTTLQNTTCVTAPEVTEGPYYVKNELVRQDLREDQDGISLILDIGVIDINTCEPLVNAYVDIWHCNATGQYSGFTTASLGLPSGTGMGGGNTTTGPPTTNGTTPGNGTMSGGGGMASTAESDQLSFLRGGYMTNSAGIVELTTIYPGFYTGRTVHIHTAVITNWTENTNGTISSEAGELRHIGQMFFDEGLNAQVLGTAAYLNTTQTRSFNDDDDILAQEDADGYNAFVQTELLGETIEDGVLGYITIGVDATAQHSFTTTNYWTPEED